MLSKLYVVLVIDTEGPACDPALELLSTWEEMEPAVHKVREPSFRHCYPDATGHATVLNWFVLDWTGFRTNPVNRSFGYHQIFDRYKKFLVSTPQDKLFWHYHHPPMDGVANHWNPLWRSSPEWVEGVEYENILNRKIIDRQWFPNCFRAGGTIEDNDTSQWLEQWIPFDYSNRSPRNVDNIADWSRASQSWDVYHPHERDYQSPGAMKRMIARCLDVESRGYSITDEEICRAFEQARETGVALLSVFLHDYRDMRAPLSVFLDRLTRLGKGYEDVSWIYARADEAIQKRMGFAAGPSPFRLHLSLDRGTGTVTASQPLFGPIPYLCYKDANGRYARVTEMVSKSETTWEFRLPAGLPLERVGVAANSSQGLSAVVTRPVA